MSAVLPSQVATSPRSEGGTESARSAQPSQRAPPNPHNRPIAPMAPLSVRAQGVKNGARWPIWRVAGGWRRPESTDVKSGSLAACDLGPPAPSPAKWRLRPSEKRHLAPFSAPSWPIFSRVFRELAHPGANGRECDSPTRSFGTTPRFSLLLVRAAPGKKCGINHGMAVWLSSSWQPPASLWRPHIRPVSGPVCRVIQHPRYWAGGWLEGGGIHRHRAWHIRGLHSSGRNSSCPQNVLYRIACGPSEMAQ
jgi:hypothetical protein